MTPADLEDFKDYPRVERFVKERLSMLYEDLRKLMVQPGYNFIAASGICDIVSGLSVSLHRPATARKVKKDWRYTNSKGVDSGLGTGELFKLVLRMYYPWQQGERKTRKAEVIYKFIRNPLAHALGVEGTSGLKVDATKCKKGPDKTAIPCWTTEELDALERAGDLDTAPAALESSGRKWVLAVERFYLGVFKLLRRLARDEVQMAAAEKRLKNKQFVWRV
jgi:hypothetical protein